MSPADKHWRYAIVLLLIAAWVGLGLIAMFRSVPSDNLRLVDGVFVGLGPIVGAAVQQVLNLGRSPQQDATIGTLVDKLPPQTTGTGPAAPVDDKQA